MSRETQQTLLQADASCEAADQAPGACVCGIKDPCGNTWLIAPHRALR